MEKQNSNCGAREFSLAEKALTVVLLRIPIVAQSAKKRKESVAVHFMAIAVLVTARNCLFGL
jgi:hypothetical protein